MSNQYHKSIYKILYRGCYVIKMFTSLRCLIFLKNYAVQNKEENISNFATEIDFTVHSSSNSVTNIYLAFQTNVFKILKSIFCNNVKQFGIQIDILSVSY